MSGTAAAGTAKSSARPAQPQERVMKKFAVVSIALAMLAATPALARVRHHQQNSISGQVEQGYYDPSKVKAGDVPFAPF
jgi:hypothetical protein